MIRTILCSSPTVVGIDYINKARIKLTSDRAIKIKLPVLYAQDPMAIAFLYYNNVNEYGELLRSIVYISNELPAEAASTVLYDKYSFGKNSELELSQTIPLDTVLWRNAELLQHESYERYQGLNGNSYYPHYNIDTDISAIPYGKKEVILDGWYTLQVVVPPRTNTDLFNGALKYDTTIEYYLDGAWYPINDIIHDTARIATILDYDGADTRNYKQEFMVLHDVTSSYERYMTKALGLELFTGIKTLRPVYKSLYTEFLLGNYVEAQHLINTIDLSLIH